MPIVDTDLKIIIRGHFLGQQFENVQWYRPEGAAFLTATAVAVGEAYWNDIKAAWRACMYTSLDLLTESIVVSEGDPTGAFGEYPIPTGEQEGTRSSGSATAFLPAFSAAGVKLTVDTRATRPGQKRFVGGQEADQANGVWDPAYITLIDALAVKFSQQIILGAPVLTGTLHPEIVRLAGDPAVVTVRQDVTGAITNPNVSTQVSRKPGRGA